MKQPMKHITMNVIKTDTGVMDLALAPPFWSKVVLRDKRLHRAIRRVIDTLVTEMRMRGAIVTPVLWTVDIEYPVFLGTANIEVRPYSSS